MTDATDLAELVFEKGPLTDDERELVDTLRAEYERVFAAPSSFGFKFDEDDR